MESLDHVPKFTHRLQRVVRRPVIPVRSEEIDGGIAPVVFQAGRSILRIEGKDRHQFHGRYPEGLQIRDLLYRRRKCPRAHARDPGIEMSRKALDMHLVDHRVRKGDPGMAVALPVVSSVAHHHTFDGGSEIVPAVARGLCAAVIFPVKPPGKGVGKQFRTVEIQTFAGQVVAVHPIAVVQALACPMHQHVPIGVRAVFFRVEADDLTGSRIVGMGKQEEFDRKSFAGIEGKIDPFVSNGSPERSGLPFRYAVGTFLTGGCEHLCHGRTLIIRQDRAGIPVRPHGTTSAPKVRSAHSGNPSRAHPGGNGQRDRDERIAARAGVCGWAGGTGRW